MIHVCYALYDPDGTYAKYIGASVSSVLSNTRDKVTVHLLCDKTLSAANKQRFAALADKRGGKIKFYDVTLPPELFNALADTNFSPASFYRMRLADVIGADVKRLIYLDADTIVNLDLKELYRYDLAGKTIAAAVDKEISENSWQNVPLITGGYIAKERYFNSGVLLIDMVRLKTRPDFFSESCAFWSNNRRFLVYPDQDILNFIFKDDSLILPAKYNTPVLNANRAAIYGAPYTPLTGAVYHYAGGQLGFDQNSPQDLLFWEHYRQTPWCDAAFIMRALSLSFAARDEQMESERALRNLLAGYRQRIFWGDAKYEEAVRRAGVFGAGDIYLKAGQLDEHGAMDISDVRRTAAECKPGEKITVIIFDYYLQLRDILNNDGCTENEQYTDGRRLITCREGIKPQLDSAVIRNL